MEIDENCIVKCSKCQYSDIIVKWRFDCGQHNGQSWPIDKGLFFRAISIAGSASGSKEWKNKLAIAASALIQFL